MGPRRALVGKHFLTPDSKRVLLGLFADGLAPLRGARLVHHAREHADEHKCCQCGDEEQNDCVGSDVGPLDLQSLNGIQSNELVSPDPLAITYRDCAARGTRRARQQEAESERRHRADRDP